MKQHVPFLVLAFLILLPLAVPVSGVTACTAPAECLTVQQAAELFGAGNYVQVSRDTCGYLTDATGARNPQYCFEQAAASPPAAAAPVRATLTTAPPERVSPATSQTTVPPPAIAPAVTTTVPATVPRTSLPTTPAGIPVYTTPAMTIAPTKPTTVPTPVPYTPVSQPGTEIAGSAKPLVITAGYHQYAPLLGASSPYFPSQVGNLSTMPFIYLQTDWIDNNEQNYFSGNFPAWANWSDFTSLRIGKDEKTHMGNFRYMSALPNVKSVLFQISRNPFPNDPAHWQNQYIPGLVTSGEVKAYHTDNDGYRYFRINFARVAKQNPGDPPYYVGTIAFEPGQLGQGAVLQTADIPFTSTGLVLKKVSVGPFSLPLPVSVISVTPGELTQAALGNPNENMILSCTDCMLVRSPSSLESSLLDMDQKFYVRVVPIYEGGKAGVPALPVEVTVRRPHPCPSVASDITVKLPSADIVWYMKPNFGEYANHWYYPWGPPYGDEFHPQGLHSYEPPPADEDKAWWETLLGTFNDVLNFFSWVVTQYSQLWNLMQDLVVKYVGDALTIGWCSDHAECTTVLKTGLQAVMAAYGIPPTLPTGPELMDLSTDYMIKLGVEQLGAGELYDAYQNLPPEAKQALQELRGKAQENSEKLAQASKDQRYEESLKYRCFFDPQFTCTKKVPDPIFSSVHPATVMVWVSNPAQNTQPTDRVLMTVSDSWHLYSKTTRVVPPLAPGEGVSIPVVLGEDYARFRKDNGGPCDPNAAVQTQQGTSSYENLSTCLQGAWQGEFQQPGTDTFVVTFSTGTGYGSGAELAGLDANSNGKQLSSVIVVDPDAGSCGIPHAVKFPQGWTIATPTYSISPTSWDYFFDSGNGVKSKNTGMLRNKP